MTLALRYAARSDVGHIREENEDSAYAGPNLLAIADGMGGHAAGEVASAVAIAAIAGLDKAPVDHPLEALAAAVSSASATMHDITIQQPKTAGMGTTLTALLWDGSSLAVCHIGDSRAYLLRDGVLHQITKDHTLVQSLVDDGKITQQEAIDHPNKSLVMRALQSGTDAQPDLFVLQAQAGDRYLLCSDGLSDMVTSEEMLRDTLIRRTNRNDAVLELIELALRKGGLDNVTCIVADVVAVDEDASGITAEQVMVVGAVANGDGRPSEALSGSPEERAQLLAPSLHHLPHQAGLTTAGPAVGLEAEAGQEQDENEIPAGAPRRRWPLVTGILVVLLVVIIGGAYAAWRYTQDQYYVGTDGKQVIIYRGVNQKVLGISLSSVYQRTGIPISQVPGTDRQAVRATITGSGSLTDARKTVSTLRQAYECQKYQTSYANWLAHKPKPQTKTVIVGGKPVIQTVTPPYPAPPKMPAGGCSSQEAPG